MYEAGDDAWIFDQLHVINASKLQTLWPIFAWNPLWLLPHFHTWSWTRNIRMFQQLMMHFWPMAFVSSDDVPSTSSSHELSPEQDILRQFDLTWEYGPCTGEVTLGLLCKLQPPLIFTLFCVFAGISRLERWERAEKFGLNPPQSVKDLILSHTEDKEYTHWFVPSICSPLCVQSSSH